jgi:hypothetical protein
MVGKLGYKTFEYLCDLAREDARLRTRASEQALVREQQRYSWPWCLTQAQCDDWNTLYRRLDP